MRAQGGRGSGRGEEGWMGGLPDDASVQAVLLFTQKHRGNTYFVRDVRELTAPLHRVALVAARF